MTADLAALRWLLDYATGCHGGVIRDGEQDACEKPAVAVIDGRGSEDESYWPACAYHANRYGAGRCVPLVVLRAALRGPS